MVIVILSDEEICECIKMGKYMLFFMVDWCLDCVFIKLVMF